MKKNIFLLLAAACLAWASQAQAQKKMKFYYYPSANVYYDIAHNQYAYDSSGLWVYTPELPNTISVNKNSKKVMVYSDNPEIWKDNKVHVLKFKNGSLKKEKTKPDKTTSRDS